MAEEKHFGLPLPVILFLAGQLSSVIIWGAILTSRVSDLELHRELDRPLVQRFFRLERDVELILIKLDEHSVKIDILENRYGGTPGVH